MGATIMRKNKNLTTIVIALAVLAVALCGTVISYMFHISEQKNNLFTPATVSCEVSEEFDGQQKSSIKVKNTGNIDAYIRIRLVSYWVDSDGNIVAKPSTMPVINVGTGWLEGTNNTYYYQKPVTPTDLTDTLISSPIILEKDENGYLQVLEVFAEGIQSKPQNAVEDSWKVTLDNNGHITVAP